MQRQVRAAIAAKNVGLAMVSDHVCAKQTQVSCYFKSMRMMRV